MTSKVHQSKLISLEPFDFADFGCSSGGGIVFAQRHLGGKNGLGLDKDPEKVKIARQAGHSAEVTDLACPSNLQGEVRFCILSHFLEHLPSVEVADRCIKAAIQLSTEFIYIQQPWFDSDENLKELGLKLYWSDWKGHPNHMKVSDLIASFSSLPDKYAHWQVTIAGRNKIKSSSEDAVHPLSSPIDQHAYSPDKHPEKRGEIQFGFPVYREVVALISKSVISDSLRNKMLRADNVLVDQPANKSCV